jgi:short-subunit dehydrogenase
MRKAFSLVAFLCLLLLNVSCATWDVSKTGQQKIASKTYVIIGASSGLGKGVAAKLGSYKANVVLAARRTELLEEIATEIRAAGGEALVVGIDVSNPADVQRLADEAVKRFMTIDVWITSAAVMAIGNFWVIPMEDHARLLDVNLKGVVYSSHAALTIFRKQGFGTLINIGSAESETPLAYHASYAASKAGIRNLNQALNQELRLAGNKKIEVVTIMPWATDTPIWGHAANYSGGTPRIGAIDGPEKVVNAIIRSSLRPRPELSVGWKAKSIYALHKKFPHFIERVSADIAHHYQIKTAPPAPPTKGSLHNPMPKEQGDGISGGVRKRIKQENKMRRQKH